MSEVKLTRLNKALREFNISLDRAVEFLASNDHIIEARPTTKISEEQYNLFLNEFSSDKSNKVESHDLSEEKRKQKEELRIQIEKEQEEKIKNQNALIEARAEVKKSVQLGKIDLDQFKKKSKSPVVEKSPKVEEGLKEIKIKKVDSEKVEIVIEKKVESNIKTQYKKLSGLKTVGDKINLDQFKKSKPSNGTNKPSFGSASSKRKRIRVTKDPVKPSPDSKKINFTKQPKSKTLSVEPSEVDVKKQISETLKKLQGRSSTSKGAKYRKEKRDFHKFKSDEDLALNEADKKTIKVTEFITVGEVATMMKVTSTDIISTCMSLGIMVTMNQRLDAETLTIVADEFGFEVEFVTADIEDSIKAIEDDPKDLLPRAPIVTVMGHVDHGKTSLLDYIREENVIAGESGGITQHIGAYNVILKDGQKITFLDTPGHEAFTAMRARGVQLTDIVIIVIAADDDVMPQTKEAISHAQAAGVPIIFAINKIDRQNSNPDKIKEKLSGMNLLIEEWGGKIQSHDISALKGTGVDELLEKVLLEAEFLELKANPDRLAIGTVVEAFLDKGKGYMSTILIQTGTLKVGDYLLAGRHSGKVKAMQDERGNAIIEAGPSIPVSILGLDGAPQAGDKFNVFEDEKEAKQIAVKRTILVREQSVRTQKHITLDEIGRRIALGDFKELNIILKGDVDGSVEALTDSFQKLSNEEIHVNIIHKAVGTITESDVLLASASDAIIIGFNVRPTGNARQIADKEEIDIRNYSIIYDAINDLKDAMEGMLSPVFKEEISGNAEIRETFKISKVGTIAGCMVTDGKIFRNSNIRIIRDGIVVNSGTLSALKRFKDDAKEVAKGYECGIQIKNYNDVKIGDVIEAYSELEVKKKIK
ncbi:MAG: translation initiation factor IF-2 [Bacteroidetes bacterium]|nr:translation initiation factor IF-2 [Bacteroidota bacterium]MDA1019327.1 translation initiation factor IF-2 [Bacteroidota bacterium]